MNQPRGWFTTTGEIVDTRVVETVEDVCDVITHEGVTQDVREYLRGVCDRVVKDLKLNEDSIVTRKTTRRIVDAVQRIVKGGNDYYAELALDRAKEVLL